MTKPILNEVFADNGKHSHWNLICPITGKNLWSEYPEEDKARGFPVCNEKPQPPEPNLPLSDIGGRFNANDMVDFANKFSQDYLIDKDDLHNWINNR